MSSPLSPRPLRIVGSASDDVKDELRDVLITYNIFGSSDASTEGHQPQQPSLGESASPFILCLDSEDTAYAKPLYQHYHSRFVWTAQSTSHELVTMLKQMLGATEGGPRHRFSSTRSPSESSTFLSVVREGLAPDGGLYILKRVPVMPASQLRYLCKARHLSYIEVAATVMGMLVDTTLTPSKLFPLIMQAYDASRWCGLEDICPVTPILLGAAPPAEKQQPSQKLPAGETYDEKSKKPSETPQETEGQEWYRVMRDVSVMELYHGPTAAFKDFALQLFPRYFNTAVEWEHEARHSSLTCSSFSGVCSSSPAAGSSAEATQEADGTQDKYMIVAATSGDTGVAAISGFVNAGNKCKVMILYPAHGVSPVQQLQMLAFDDGTHVRVLAVDSDFDFCQKTAKSIFADEALKERLASRTPSVRLSSANSINWGRLIPQVVFYFWAYRQHVQRASTHAKEAPSGGWQMDNPIDVVVPCGNFGNILAGYVARLMDLPIRRLVVAANKNDVLYDFIQTGCYDTRNRPLHRTASPSIDIIRASNVERFLFLLSGGDTTCVASLMHNLETVGHFTLPAAMKQKMSEAFWAGRCDEVECAATIKAVFEASAGKRLLDPHTAVAVHVAHVYRQCLQLEGELTGINRADVLLPPLVIASTAHWAKFPEPVLHALKGEAMELGKPATSPVEAIARVRELYQCVCALGSAGGVEVHPALVAALEMAERQASAPRMSSAAQEAVVAELEDFAAV